MATASGSSIQHRLLSEDQLKHMSRNIKTFVPQGHSGISQEGVNDIKAICEHVLSTAAGPALDVSHRIAAWNTLCALIDQCSQSNLQYLQDAICEANLWHRALQLYLDQSHIARPKSAKQLLTTLSSSIRTCTSISQARSYASSRLVDGLLLEDDHRSAQACLRALAHFLGKDALALDDVLQALRGRLDGNAEARSEDLLDIVFAWVRRADFGSLPGQLASVILDKLEIDSDSESSTLPIWSRPLECAITSQGIGLDDLRVHILPTLFKRSVSGFLAFLYDHGLERFLSGHELGDGTPAQTQLLYAALRTGKELGLVAETDDAKVSQTSSAIYIPVRAIGRLLIRNSRDARMTGLSLLITSHGMTRPFTESGLKCLRHHLSTFFANTDPNFRSELFSLMQKLMDRLRATTAVLARQAKPEGNAASSATAMYEYHEAFILWLVRMLRFELRSTASYQRHISALKTLFVVMRSGLDHNVSLSALSKSALGEAIWPLHLSLLTAGLRRTLIDLLMDPFDDVRQTSAAMLSLYYSPLLHTEDKRIWCDELRRTIDRAENSMLATGRADQADGVAHMYGLLYRVSGNIPAMKGSSRSSRQALLARLVEDVERMLDYARQYLATAVGKYPMHGLLTSLRYVVTQDGCRIDFERFPERSTACLHRVWDTVRPILCNDAPEGYAPDNMEDTAVSVTKDTLSYCWRALKESSLLLGVMVTQNILSSDARVSLSDLCFIELAELRHRGAFSTVAQTWLLCCTRCKELQNAGGRRLLHVWYENVLLILNSKATINTRRSAGLPSLLCGLLIADGGPNLVAQAFGDLTAIARLPVGTADAQEGGMPQVHAINCIKDILKNTRLAEHSERYVPSSLRLAAHSLKAETWAVRNCGLMLFRAVIDRLLGTNDAYLDDAAVSVQLLSTREHPEILDVVLDLLVDKRSRSEGFQAQDNASVFPALQLLQRIQVPQGRRVEVGTAVFLLTVSPSWHVRDKAARAYAGLHSFDEVSEEILELMSCTDRKDQNATHGALLCVKHLISRLRWLWSAPVQQTKDKRVPKLHTSVQGARFTTLVTTNQSLYHECTCPDVKAAYVDALVEGMRYVQSIHGVTAETGVSDQFDISHELNDTLTADGFDMAEGGLRRSLAQALAYELYWTRSTTEDDINRMVALIVSFAQADGDACSACFAELRRLDLGHTRDLAASIQILLNASGVILGGSYHMGLKCEVQSLLLDLATSLPLLDANGHSTAALVTAISLASSPLGKSSGQRYADQWLQLQAVAIEYCLQNHPDTDHIGILKIDHWADACCSAVKGSGLYSSAAAALAVGRLKASWQYIESHRPDMLRSLAFAVYDLLNDDDEDIRVLASQTTSRMLELDPRGALSSDVEPAEASRRLVCFMVKKWSHDQWFAEEAFHRAYGHTELQDQSVAKWLSQLTTTDTALFAEEKQNLYVDEAREVKMWSQVVMALCATSLPRSPVAALARWALDGIDALIEMTKAGMNGPLGWSSKPEVLTLGLQVISGSEALLHFVEQGIRLPIPPSAIRLKLGTLASSAAIHGINDLWMQELDRVLAWAVAGKVRKCRELLDTVV